MTNIDALKLSFLIIAPLVVLLVLFLLFKFFIFSYIQKKYFKQFCYRRIYKIVQNNDFYLINNFEFEIDESVVTRIDHIIFGDKFIYVCLDKYFEANLMGKDNDPSLVLVDIKHNKKEYTDNLFHSMAKLLHQFSSVTNISTELLIGIANINTNCQTKIKSDSNQLFIIQINKLKKIIKLVEQRDVKPINAKALEKTVHAVARSNKRNKKKMA